MRNITKIFTLVLSLILLFAVSCSNDDKTGVPNNPPENDTEITDGETESGGTGSEGGSEEGGSEEGDGGTETPPSETETIEEIDEEGFPPELLGTYRDERLPDKFRDAKVSLSGIGIWMKGKQMFQKKDGSTGIQDMDSKIKKWKKTTKGGKIIKVEGERDKGHGCYTVTFDYETKTISGTFKFPEAGADWSFSGTKR